MEGDLILLKKALKTTPLLTFPDLSRPLIVETDASYKALGAVLAQKKEDGRVHTVQYEIRTMTSAERNYAKCEREELSVIFELNKLQIYPPSSERFTVVTENISLK